MEIVDTGSGRLGSADAISYLQAFSTGVDQAGQVDLECSEEYT